MFYNDLSPIPNTTKCKARIKTGGHLSDPAQRSTSPRHERREGSAPIPVNVSEYLNDDQCLSLRQMESFGWQLAFVRRPQFQDPVVIVSNEGKSQYGILELNGSINTRSMLDLRA